MTVKVYKRGSYTKAIAKYTDLPQIRVGVPRRNSPRHDGSGVTNAVLLGLHQYGGNNFPARRPLTVLETSKPFLASINVAIAAGTQAAFEVAGQAGADIVKASIMSGLPPPVTEGTMKSRKENKTDNTPLIDTHRLLNAIGYEVK